jgi:Domain of unknown function (DUF1877)
MSQSATFYRVSQDTFRQLENSNNKQHFDISSAKDYTTLQGSFMALEYILSKAQDLSAIELINELFDPKQSLDGPDLESLTLEKKMEFYENGGVIHYLDNATISKLSGLLDKFSELDIHSKYDSDELNNNRIYPEVWHNDNSPDQAYNERHILDDFVQLKKIIKQAADDIDYILVFVG